MTSAKKAKTITPKRLSRLVEALVLRGTSNDMLLAKLLRFGITIFVRPCEYRSPKIGGGRLLIENAKATNGRGNGSERDRDLRDVDPRDLSIIEQLVDQLHTLAIDAGGWDRLFARLSSRLARQCKALKMRRICFYTLRHQGMANAKRWMTQAEVAAAAGHRTTRTAFTHYARRSSGWHPDLPRLGRPSPASVARVVVSPKSRRQHRAQRSLAW